MESDRDGQISRTKLATSYQMQECVLYGSVLDQFVPVRFATFEWITTLGFGTPFSRTVWSRFYGIPRTWDVLQFENRKWSWCMSQVYLISFNSSKLFRLRRRFNVDTTSPHHNVWQYRYIGSELHLFLYKRLQARNLIQSVLLLSEK